MDVWYNAFWELSTERQIGFVPGPIPQSAIERYVSDWPYDLADIFRRCIIEMDRVFLTPPEDLQEAAPITGNKGAR